MTDSPSSQPLEGASNTPRLSLAQIEAEVDRFLAIAHVSGNEEARELLAEMILTGLKLVADGADLGQLKLVRTSLKEMRHAYRIFNPYRGTRKISIFGSARTPEQDPDYAMCRAFSRIVSAAGWMVITGAGDGIMKAGHEGPELEKCFGLRIRLPFEAAANNLIEGDPKLVNFRYFFTRKLMFMAHSDAVAAFPGGFGTQDELFEALTLVQTGKSNLVPIVLLEHENGGYWSSWESGIIAKLREKHLISPEDTKLYSIHHDAQAASDEVERFYRRYHSMRYVGNELVLRLQWQLTAEELDRLESIYAPLFVASGRIRMTSALPGEDEHLDLPRIAFRFDRKHWGHLRCFLNDINNAPAPTPLA
ncbi:MAG: LOG family protein [Phycisphaerales bacterium]|nr:LOG family protein [Phycisphaerales bacterium]